MKREVIMKRQVVFVVFLMVFLVMVGSVSAAVNKAEFKAVFSVPSTEIPNEVIVNQFFNKYTEYSLGVSQNIISLSIDTDVNLVKHDSYVRVVLVDLNGNEFLVYQAGFPFEDVIELQGVCEETCVLNSVRPLKLIIEMSNDGSIIYIKKINYLSQGKSLNKMTVASVSEAQDLVAKSQKDFKINEFEKKDLTWVAGDIPTCGLSYSEKKALFGGWFGTTCGFECYTGEGVFEFCTQDVNGTQQQTQKYDVVLFDWRNRHGENWMSPVKNQGGCGSCWAFGSAGAVEGVINTYYNQHLDINLSEQDLLCKTSGSCGGGTAFTALNYIKSNGIVNESCCSYKASDSCCDTTCPRCDDWQTSLWQIVNTKSVAPFGVNSRDINIKNNLTEKGPLTMEGPISYWSHAIVLSGYGYDEEGSYWVIKNSWGESWGDKGYGKIRISPYLSASQTGFRSAEEPYTPNVANSEKLCVDGDSDGYCSWGIGNKPTICVPDIGLDEIGYDCCSSLCQLESDCDDFNFSIGVCLNENLYCGEIPMVYNGEFLVSEYHYGSYMVSGDLSCCGDDFGEFLIEDKCCNNYTDWIDTSEICQPTYINVSLFSGLAPSPAQEQEELFANVSQMIYFKANSTSFGTECLDCVYRWYVDGVLQAQGMEYSTNDLSPIEHVITLRAIDSNKVFNEKSMIVAVDLKQITEDSFNQIFPRVQENKIVWEDYRNGNADIYLYDFISETETRITSEEDANQTNPGLWGDIIVWEDYRDWDRADIYFYNISESSEFQITDTLPNQVNPRIYEDKIVYEDWTNGWGRGDIFIYNLTSSSKIALHNDDEYHLHPMMYEDIIVFDYKPSILFREEVYIYNLSNGVEYNLTYDSYEQSNASVYKNIVVWEDYHGDSDIYVFDIETKTQRQLTNNIEDQINVDIYEDIIVWEDYRNGNADIYMYNLSSDTEVRITANSADQKNPSVYGDILVWEDYRNGNADIYMTNISFLGESGLLCNLINAYWSDQLVVNDTQVTLILEGTNCDEEEINFEIWEYDPTALAPDDYVVSIADSYDQTTWVAQYLDEGGLDPDPEYYFYAIVVSTGQIIKSSDPMLEVLGTCITSSFYRDFDEDGYGNLTDVVEECSAPAGYVDNSNDCNDSNVNINPGISEVGGTSLCIDEIDNNCDLECDWDNEFCTHGDFGCSVLVLGSFLPDTSVEENTNFSIICPVNTNKPTALTSVYAETEENSCNFMNLNIIGPFHNYNFSCNSGIYTGVNKTVTCFINQSITYSSTGNENSSMEFEVLEGSCIDFDEDGYNTTSGGDCGGVGDIDCDDTNINVHPGATEICNGIDDDCNVNTVDGSGEVWYNNPTTCGLGICGSNGVLTCSGGVQFDTCISGIPTGADDDCDNVDDDCNGVADDNYVSTPTLCGIGECAASGLLTCISGSEQDSCIPGSPISEICDGLDNDCDTNIDNDLTASLNSDQDGVCFGSAQTCSGAGGWIDNYTGIANYENPEVTCDSLDNNCDVFVDETYTNCVGATPYCNAGVCVECINDVDCDDGAYCNGVEVCISNVCQSGTAPDCDDSVGCTIDSCNELGDICENIADDTFCDNGLFCDGNEYCDAILDCQGGVVQTCTDGISCTLDSCDEGINITDDIGSCVFDTSSCSCSAQGPAPVECDDSNSCTDDICNASLQCENTNNDSNSCDDGFWCTINDICSSGTCSGDVRNCADTVGCTIDSCNELGDICENIADDTFCDKGLFCNGIETCDPVLDCQAGTPFDCSGNDLVEIATCDNDPDLNAFTWDASPAFTSVCQEPGTCTDNLIREYSHACNMSACNADCEVDLDCDDLDPLTADICLPDCSCLNTEEACVIDDISWATFSANESDFVELVIRGTDCQGRQVNITIWEYDGIAQELFGDDRVVNDPGLLIFNESGVASFLWEAEWQDDGFFNLGGDPEYYIKVEIDDQEYESEKEAGELLSVALTKRKFEIRNIPLQQGKNTFGLPLFLENMSIEDVFSDISSNVDYIYTYENEFKIYHFDGKPSNLKNLEVGKGYFIFMNTADILTINGSKRNENLERPNIILDSGWNLMGTFSRTRNASSILRDISFEELYEYNETSGDYNLIDGASILDEEKSYWIKVGGQSVFRPVTGVVIFNEE